MILILRNDTLNSKLNTKNTQRRNKKNGKKIQVYIYVTSKGYRVIVVLYNINESHHTVKC